jgi:hypothetical protein
MILRSLKLRFKVIKFIEQDFTYNNRFLYKTFITVIKNYNICI